MSDAARTTVSPKLLLVNHFALQTVCGTTVLFAEILRLAPQSAPQTPFAYESYESYPSVAEFLAQLDAEHADASCVVAANAHIEVLWEFSEALFGWCLARGIAAYVYAHDYWPHHKDGLATLTTRYGAGLLAATPSLADQLSQAGFNAQVVESGVALPDVWPAVKIPASPKVVASVARLVQRKRLRDIVRAYGDSGIDGFARLYLRVAPSQVYSALADAELLLDIHTEVARARLKNVEVDRRSGERSNHDVEDDWYPDYASYSVYICASSYEGFGMPVVEAAFYGCPPLMSDIAPHQRSARVLFGESAGDYLFPVGDHRALADLLRDEITTGRRKAFLDSRIDEIRASITSHWSLGTTATALAQLARRVKA